MDIVSTAAADSREVVDGVHNFSLLAGERMSTLQFRIDPGSSVPMHDHPHEQAGYLLQGEVTVVLDGDERVLRAGDAYCIPGNESHSFENQGDEPAIGIDVFSPPRDLAPFADDE
jgi:quercetin dioxygenase-like cupin family protein